MEWHNPMGLHSSKRVCSHLGRYIVQNTGQYNVGSAAYSRAYSEISWFDFTLSTNVKVQFAQDNSLL